MVVYHSPLVTQPEDRDMLDIKPKEKQADVHFYVRQAYADKIDELCEQTGASRGRVLEALIDFYEEHH